MIRSFSKIVTNLAVCVAVLTSVSLATAGNKEKFNLSQKSLSSGGSGNSSFRASLSTTPRKLSTASNGNSNGSSNTSSLNQFRTMKSLSGQKLGNSSTNNFPAAIGQFQQTGPSSKKLHKFNQGLSTLNLNGNPNSVTLNGAAAGHIKLGGQPTGNFQNLLTDKKLTIKHLDQFGQGLGGLSSNSDPNCKPGKDCHHDCHYPWWPIFINNNHCHVGSNCPPVNHVTVIEQPIVVSAPQVVAPFADLELIDVRIVDLGDPARNFGPRCRAVFRNVGTLPVSNFQLLMMASRDGAPNPTAPAATVEIVGLAPGQIASADIRLPLTPELPTLGALIVVLDSAVQIGEANEQNNVVVLDRTKIAVADIAAVQ